MAGKVEEGFPCYDIPLDEPAIRVTRHDTLAIGAERAAAYPAIGLSRISFPVQRLNHCARFPLTQFQGKPVRRAENQAIIGAERAILEAIIPSPEGLDTVPGFLHLRGSLLGQSLLGKEGIEVPDNQQMIERSAGSPRSLGIDRAPFYPA